MAEPAAEAQPQVPCTLEANVVRDIVVDQLRLKQLEKVFTFLLPRGRCYLLLHLLNSFCVARFPRVFLA